MGLSASLQGLTLPFGTDFPGTPQDFINWIAQYEAIVGLEDFNGVNFGSGTPAPSDQDKPWFKLDNSGNPIGWFAWNGAAWVAIPVIPQSGSTSSRPSSPTAYQQYFDTTINCLIQWNGSNWTTVSGVVGDYKFVDATDSGTAETNNPGWSVVTDAGICGRVLGVAGSGTGLTVRAQGASVGEENHTLTQAELPAVSITAPFTPAVANGNNPNPVGGLLSQGISNTGTLTSNPIGSGSAHNTMQPTLFLFLMHKDS